ncbi:MAG TPA: hydrogenase subunit beta, partial [Bacteroidales bacterium]|nr:hydrogenase subunit beta [Bacteroidales bacterium]
MNIERRLVRKNSLEKLFEILKQNKKSVFAPVVKNGKASFKTVESFSTVAEDYIQTTQSSKELVFPRVEKFLDYEKNGKDVSVKGFDYQNVPDTVLWGVRPCDTIGFGALNSIFNWDYKDEIYNARLAKTTILSFSCNKSDEYCFCTSVGGNPGSTAGSDILFTKLGADGD